MSLKITDAVTFVGKIDWELRRFHGEQLTTNHGSSYNSYLIQDEKTVLIDTVWTPFSGEYIKNLKKIIDIKKIDYIIANHAEPDHSGALSHLMAMIPDTPVYCTANGIKSLKGYYHKDWNFVPVKTGDRLNIGSKEIIFIEAAMLHWPDTMMNYLTGDNILFSNDVFGQHFASEFMFNDLVDEHELNYEALKYYANIITPYVKKVTAKMEEFRAMNLPLNMICPAHGIIWRKNPEQIIEKYSEWAKDYAENQITIIYDTMYNSTRKMAESIAQGIASVDNNLTVKLFNAARADNSDIIAEVFKSKGILVGSPNLNSGILNSIAAILEEIKGLKFMNKKAGSFGSYGWSPAQIKLINDSLIEAGFELVGDGLKVQWNPDEKATEQCLEFGKGFARTFI
jgi:anaerobic nitric oxide reductase flavorubredoxin